VEEFEAKESNQQTLVSAVNQYATHTGKY